jgi:hypothetical protein
MAALGVEPDVADAYSVGFVEFDLDRYLVFAQ